MLPRAQRLRKPREFRVVVAGARTRRGGRATVHASEALILHVAPRRSGLGPRLRFGFTISRKCARRAHDRNRLKRRLSEVARNDIGRAYTGAIAYDCVIVARPAAVEMAFGALRSDLLALAARVGLGAGADLT